MNYIISVIQPESLPQMTELCKKLGLPLTVTFHAHGTAVQSMLDLLGIESTEKRVVIALVNQEKIPKFMKECKRSLNIGVPGHGVVAAIPMKSVGGGKTLAYLNGEEQGAKFTPNMNYAYELVVVIANEGYTDSVMNAARSAGATGGTVLHGKGSCSGESQKFFNVSIAQEKEVILIVSPSARKADIMHAIVRKAGPDSEAGAIVFSLPVSEVAGFGMFDDDDV